MRCLRRWEWSRGRDTVRHNRRQSEAYAVRQIITATGQRSHNQTPVGIVGWLRCTKQRLAPRCSDVSGLRLPKRLRFDTKSETSTEPVDNSVDEPKPCSLAQGFITILLDWLNFDRRNLVSNSISYGILARTESSRTGTGFRIGVKPLLCTIGPKSRP